MKAHISIIKSSEVMKQLWPRLWRNLCASFLSKCSLQNTVKRNRSQRCFHGRRLRQRMRDLFSAIFADIAETVLCEIARGSELEVTENARVSTSIYMSWCSRVRKLENEHFTSTSYKRHARVSATMQWKSTVLFNCKILREFLRRSKRRAF